MQTAAESNRRRGYNKNGVAEAKESLEAWVTRHDDTAIRRNAGDELGNLKVMNGNELTSTLLGNSKRWVSLRL